MNELILRSRQAFIIKKVLFQIFFATLQQGNNKKGKQNGNE